MKRDSPGVEEYELQNGLSGQQKSHRDLQGFHFSVLKVSYGSSSIPGKIYSLNSSSNPMPLPNN
jgi:hypothetical protein